MTLRSDDLGDFTARADNEICSACMEPVIDCLSGLTDCNGGPVLETLGEG